MQARNVGWTLQRRCRGQATAAIFVAAAAAGCTQQKLFTTDGRPETLAYITETIFVPYCGTSECHSSMVKRGGYAFDTVEAAQESIAKYPLILPCPSGPPCADDDGSSYLLQVINDQDAYGHRMPLDEPLANRDQFLIKLWIRDGADGYVPQ